MKKLLAGVALASALTTNAFAMSEGAIADISIGFSTPVIDPTLALGSAAPGTDVINDLGINGASLQANMWAEFTHLIPIVPNVRVETATLGYTGTSSTTYNIGTQSVTLNGTSVVNLDNQDGILFWGIPFVTLIPFVDKADFGIGAKVINGKLGAEALGVGQYVDIQAVVPYGWLRAAVSVPVINIGLALDMKTIGTDLVDPVNGLFGIKANFIETVYKATWGLALPVPVITLEAGVELGYKTTTLDVEVPGSLYVNGAFNGVIFGIYGVFGI